MSAQEYRIERGVPFTGRQYIAAGRRPTYPFEDLGVGDRMFVPSRATKFSKETRLYAAYHHFRHSRKWNLDWEHGHHHGVTGFWIYRRPGEAVMRRMRKRS